MKITVISGEYNQSARNPALLVAALSSPSISRRSPSVARRADRALRGELGRYLRDRGFEGKHLTAAMLSPLASPHFAALFVGWKQPAEVTFETIADYRKFGDMAGDRARKMRARRVAISCEGLRFERPEFARAFIEGLVLGGYSYTDYKGKKKKNADKKNGGKTAIEELIFTAAPKSLRPDVWRTAQLMTRATELARDLVNTPPNDCTPLFLAARARDIARRGRLAARIYRRAELKRMGANLLLAVSLGSSEEPCLISLRYRPRGRVTKRLAIVGKGVTFDSGGLNVKSLASMRDMKSDMAGAAAVLGVMSVIRELAPSIEVRAYIPATENMINGEAMRLGDVYTGMNGTTVEIMNTDAEGRLILGDALTLACKEGADEVIDLATLTGASMVALGTDYAGLFSTDDAQVRALTRAGEEAGERMWRLPFAPEYRESIDSAVADIKNTGGQYGGAITGALFLKEFVTVKRFAHLDIAGPSFRDGDRGHLKRGGTGYGVRTLLNYLRAK
jgi:leucyl aminopeptidase